MININLINCQEITYAIDLDKRNDAISLLIESKVDLANSKYDDSFKKLEKAIQTDSTYRDLYLQIYQVWNKSKLNSYKIIDLLKKGERIFQEDDELTFYRAEIYRSLNNYSKAIEEYTNAMKYAKTNGEDYFLVPYYYQNRGITYTHLKQYKLALNDYNYLLKLDSTSKSGFVNRGIVLFQMAEKEKACLDWKKAKSLGESTSNSYIQKFCIKK